MADNVEITSGSGTTISSDQVGTVHYQKIKLASGEADSSVMVYATTDNALYVDVRKLPTTDVGILEDMLTSLQLLDNIVSGNEAQVDIVAALPAGTAEIGSVALTSTDSDALAAIETAVEGTLTISGTVTSNLGTTDASNLTDIKTAVEILDNAISGNEMQVDVVGALPAGANAIGKLAANSGVDIGDVDVLSIAAGDNNIGNVDIVSGTLTSITNDVNIADGGNTITVDGTVTSNLGTTDASNLTDIKTAVEIIDNAIDGTEMQVDVKTIAAGDNNIGNVDLASSIPAGTNNIGDVDILTIAAGDNNIGNVDIASAIPAGTNEMGSVALTSTDSDNIATVAGAVSGSEMQVDVVAALPAGANNIGDVDIASALPGGTAEIGSVSLASTDSDNIATIAGAVSGSEMQVDVVASLPAGENHLGNVGMEDDTVIITPIVAGTTDAYADGDVLFDTTEIASAVRNAGDTLILQSVHLVDKEDQSEEVDLLFLSSTDTIGTVNSAVSISDASALKTLGFVKVESTNYCDLVGSQVATLTGVGLVMESTGTSLYCAGITRGTPTYTSTDSLQVTFGFLRN